MLKLANPWMYAVLAAALAISFSAGMVVEARWSQNLLITRAEEQQAKAIAALNKKVKEQQDAAVAQAAERSKREDDLAVENQKLLKEAEDAASNNDAVSEGSVRAINRAGAGRMPR